MPYVRILGFVTLLLRLMAAAGPVLAATPMPADQAFQLRAQLDEEEGIELTWTIAPGYYLYRDKIVVTLDGQRVRIATEKGEPKDDPNFGMTEVYHASTTATVPAELLPEKGRIIVTYQGCGENTICYPPIAKTVDLATLLIAEAPEDNEAVNPARRRQQRERTFRHGGRPRPMEQAQKSGMLGGSLLTIVLAFLGFGLLLSFTPCVFPMIPILSGMLARSGSRLSLTRSFVLSASYVVAMAAAYGTLGIFVAWSGENLQTVLQTPLAVLGHERAVRGARAVDVWALRTAVAAILDREARDQCGQQRFDRRRRAARFWLGADRRSLCDATAGGSAGVCCADRGGRCAARWRCSRLASAWGCR